MKRTVILLFVMVIGAIGQVKAENGDHFWLIKGGILWRDADEKPDSMKTLGLVYGYGLTQRFSLELDYIRTLSGGAYVKTAPAAEKGEYKIWLGSANIAYRHLLVPAVYLKAKVGFTYGSESRSSDIASDQDESLSGVSANLGLGYLAGPLFGSSTTFELSYTWHKQDITSAMLGVNVTF